MRLLIVTAGDSPHSQPWVDAFTEAGHEVIVFAYPPLTQEFRGAQRVREVFGSGPIGRGRWLRGAVTAEAPDVVSLHYVSVDAWALSRLRVPFVASVWGSDILVDIEGHPLKRALVISALKRAALVVSPAEHLTQRLIATGIEPSAIVTVQYGVDTSALQPSGEQPRQAPVTVVSTRALKDVYGNEDLVRAAALAQAGTLARLVFVAGGPLEAQLRELAVALGVSDIVEFVGGVTPAEVPRYLREADVYCSMSRSDGTSLSLLEAMAVGLPSVVSDIPANREWIDDGVSGVLVEPGDVSGLAAAFNRVARDEHLRADIGAQARATVVERGDLATNTARIVAAVAKVGPR